MPLDTTNFHPQGPVKSVDLMQFYNLFTGVMTDQPVAHSNSMTVGGSQGLTTVPLRVYGAVGQNTNLIDLYADKNQAQPGFGFSAAGRFAWGPGGASPQDTFLSRIALQNGHGSDTPGLLITPTLEVAGVAVAQAHRVYNLNTEGAATYERLNMLAAGNNFFIMSEAAGAGVFRDLYVGTQGAAALYLRTTNINRWVVLATGELVAAGDNLFDIGQSSVNRPRNLYVANTVYANSTLNINGTASLIANGTDIQSNSALIAGNGFMFVGVQKDTYLKRTGVAQLEIDGIINPISGFVAGSIKTADLQANAVTNLIANYGQGTVWSTTTVGQWLETNVQITCTASGAQCRLDIQVLFQHSAADSLVYVGFGWDGTVVQGLVAQYIAVANRAQIFNAFVYVTPPAGSHRFAIFANNGSPGTLSTVTATAAVISLMEIKK